MHTPARIDAYTIQNSETMIVCPRLNYLPDKHDKYNTTPMSAIHGTMT